VPRERRAVPRQGRWWQKGVLATFVVAALVAIGASVGARGGANAASILFEEASASLGVAEARLDTWGVAVSDWNGDGCDDLYVSRHLQKDPRIYRNGCPGQFTDEIDRFQAVNPLNQPWDRHSVAFGHFDPDARLDLFISAGGGGPDGSCTQVVCQDQLYHQQPNGEFIDIAPELGITRGPAGKGGGRFGTWFDYDADGDQDLFVGHVAWKMRPEESKNLLWRNDGGAFTYAAQQAGLANFETSSSGVATDIDEDGDLDLITVPGRGVSVYLNNGNGTFAFTSLNLTGVLSAAPGDYDNDGDLDLFVSRIKGARALPSILLRNDPAGQWTDVTTSAGAGYAFAGSAHWVDVDNDGWLDLFVVREASRIGGEIVKNPNVLLRNLGNGSFVDVATQAGVTGPTDSTDKLRSSGSWGDFDRDGRVDLVTLTGRRSQRSVQVYLNRTASGNAWVTLHLRQPDGNPDAIGAKVWTTAGGLTQYRELTSGTADKSQSPPYLVIGLGTSTMIDELKVRWLDGTLYTLTDLTVNRHYLLDRDGGLQEIP
jgi:enediyne biosynthesis protein E4